MSAPGPIFTLVSRIQCSDMRDFWLFAARMGRHRGMLAVAACCAAISAMGLGAGIVGLSPILKNILGDEGATLPHIVGGLSEQLSKVTGGGVSIPSGWIAALPAGRFEAVLWLIGSLAALTAVGATANFLHAYLSQTLATRVIAGIRRDAFRRVLHMPLETALAQSHGAGSEGSGQASGVSDIVSRIINDSIRLNSGFLALVDKGPAQVTKGIVAFIAAVVVDWRSLAAAPVAIVMGIIVRKLGKRVRRASRGAMEAQSRLMHATTESLQGLRVVKAQGGERYELGRFSRFNRTFLRETLRARTARALAGPLLETMGILVMGAWALIFANQIINHGMAPGSFIASLAGLGVAAASLKPFSSIVQEVQGSAPAAQRIADLIRAEVEEALLPPKSAPRPRLARHAKTIEFDGVRFAYPRADSPALRGVSLTIEHGETVAFVGGNGSGKTTLLSMVPRLLSPDGGRILIDGADIGRVSLRSLRRQIGVVTQEVVLFQGTIRSNIVYGAEGATSERIEAAARLARAHDFIAAKPGGYDAPVGDQGVTLSGGQRQRIAIARAFLRDPAILILDEATSMIDAESEAQIAEAIGEFSQGRTTLVIAHRLSTVINADRIVVLDSGAIVDVGRHDELLDRCDTYRTLTASQLIHSPA